VIIMAAWYDTIDKKIVGAQPGTKAYLHEERHKWQDSKGLLKLDDTAAIFASGATAFLLWVYAPAQIAIETSRYIITGYFLFRIGLEVDAWIYALWHEESTYAG
jgi:hypothetical protein